MYLKKGQLPILLFNLLVMLLFLLIFLKRKNYEFIFYIAVLMFFIILMLYTNKTMEYPNSVLWGLTLWSMLHLSGGGIFIGGRPLYDFMLLKLIGDPYNIFKYDQFVHALGLFVATLALYYVLSPIVKKIRAKWAFYAIILAAGLGLGAINEIVEFIATVIVPKTGVGGYENTLLDLVADFMGAAGATLYMGIKERNTVLFKISAAHPQPQIYQISRFGHLPSRIISPKPRRKHYFL